MILSIEEKQELGCRKIMLQNTYMNYGYARISTIDRMPMQKDTLESDGCGKVVTEQISGASAKLSDVSTRGTDIRFS